MGQGGKLTIKSYFMSESYYFTLDDGIYRWKQFVGAIHENKFDSCNSYLFSAADLGYINDNVECVNSEILYKYENRGYERTS